MGVEPALAGTAIGAGGDAVGRQKREAPAQAGRVLQHDVGALGRLHRVVGLEQADAVLPGEDEVALFAEADVGVRPEPVLQLAEEAEREARQADVLGQRELLADRGGGQRRRGAGEGRIALDHRDRAGKALLAQEIRDRRADDGAADDDDIRAGHDDPCLAIRVSDGSGTSFAARAQGGRGGNGALASEKPLRQNSGMRTGEQGPLR